MERAIADIYARGMYAAARDAGKTDEVREELLGLRDILRAEKLFRRFLQDPAISRDEKKEKIRTIFDGKVTDETRNFLCLLVDKGRMALFPKITEQYVAIDDAEHAVAEGVIQSAVPLTPDQLSRFEEQVGAFYGKKIVLRNRVEPKLIGGVKIYAEDRLIDASLASRLEELNERIQRG